MNVFDVTYTIASCKHTFTVGSIFNSIAAHTKNGTAPKKLENFVQWFFPRIKNVESPDDKLNYLMGAMPNEYKMALNELINSGLVEITEGENNEFFINLTSEGVIYLPKKQSNGNDTLERIKMDAEQIRQLERDAPPEKKGFFKSMFNG